jgi:hypothetical protein
MPKIKRQKSGDRSQNSAYKTPQRRKERRETDKILGALLYFQRRQKTYVMNQKKMGFEMQQVFR